MSENIWHNMFDGKYFCRVVANNGGGMLQVLDGDDIIFQKHVTLSYGARFGPDVEDVRQWEQMIINFIDNEYSPRSS